ncbi:nucleoid-associated protein Lsr2 [Rhodococcus sp. Br-6]|nr:nucleoid-associated protein Lsr2 [Rhodococcus sp. Br-6]
MVYKIVVETFDDVDGQKIESRGETIVFSVDGVEYSIDLRDENAAELRDLLGGYIRRARRIGGHKRWATDLVSESGVPAVRRWAHENGYPPHHKSRIPRTVLEHFSAAHRD